MRAFSLVLILANLFFFGWSRLASSESDIGVLLTGPSGAPLMLAAEMPPPRQPSLEPATPGATLEESEESNEAESPRQMAAVDSNCRSVGPFIELTEAARASVALHAIGLAPRQRLAQGEFWVGYWVNIPNLGDREKAERALDTLQSRGIPDAYILSTAATANALSVGVFPEYSNAQARVEELRQLGFQPEILDRKRTEPVYWIDVDLKSPGQTIDDVLVQMDPGKIKRIETRVCPVATAPSGASG